MALKKLFLLSMIALLLTAGCDLLDPARPTPQPDTEVFGNLLEVTQLPDAPGQWKVVVRVGVPRALTRAEAEEGHMVPEVEEGISAEITVGLDTVVLKEDQPVAVEDFNPGTELVAIPNPGTTVMIGSSLLTLEANYLMDFETYRRWRLPRLAGNDPETRDDPARINSDAVEQAPIPVADGRVLYFSARLRPPARANQSWQGAVREGLELPAEGEFTRERSYRSELGDAGWSTPELVEIQGTEQYRSVRVSWVNENETRLLATVSGAEEGQWVGRSERRSPRQSWGGLVRLDELGEDAADAVYLAGSDTKITFVSTRGGGQQSDLYLYDSETEDGPLPLEPRVNTLASEWAPRVGADNELFFDRGDRQMLLAAGSVTTLRLPLPHRVVISQCAPTEDGQWVFLCMPKLRPGDLDQDIYVASWSSDGGLGEPIPVDDWKPEDSL